MEAPTGTVRARRAEIQNLLLRERLKPMQDAELRRAEERRAIEGARKQREVAIKSRADEIRYRQDFRIRKGVGDVLACVVRGLTGGDHRGHSAAPKEG